MFKPYKVIPDWYQREWSPASGSDELPQMRWSDLLQVVRDMAPNPHRSQTTTSLVQRLRAEAENYSPRELLQQVLICASTLMKPQGPILAEPSFETVPVMMPHWSCTDVEVALSYTCSGVELTLAQHRYNDFISGYGVWGTPPEILRSLFLLVMGLSCAHGLETPRKGQEIKVSRAA